MLTRLRASPHGRGMKRNRKQDAAKGKPPPSQTAEVVPYRREGSLPDWMEVLPRSFGPDLGDVGLNVGRGLLQKAFERWGLEFSEAALQRAVAAYCLPSINHLYYVVFEGNKSPSDVLSAVLGVYPNAEVVSLFDENKNPVYTGGTTPDETGRTVGDAREYFVLAAKAWENGLSVAELNEAIEDKLAAKMGATARETTSRATAEPRPDRSPEEVAAMLKDSILGRLQEKFEKQLREIELPEGRFTTIEQARGGKAFAKTFYDLQKRREKLGLPPLERPDRVKEAGSMAAEYYDHHTKTGEFIPPKPRGRPRKVAQREAAPAG